MTIGPHALTLRVGHYLGFDGSDQEAITLDDCLRICGVQCTCPLQERFLNFVANGLCQDEPANSAGT
jgi:hypothetical protein